MTPHYPSPAIPFFSVADVPVLRFLFLSRLMQLRNVARLLANACSYSRRRTSLSRNRLHDSGVQRKAYLPSLICCSAVPRWL